MTINSALYILRSTTLVRGNNPQTHPIQPPPSTHYLHPHPIPSSSGLPPVAETTDDLSPLILTAMDLTYKHLEVCLQELNPHFVFFDFANWVPSLARGLGIKSIHYSSLSSAFIGYVFGHTKPNDSMQQPVGFPSSSIKLYKYEVDLLNFLQWIVERYIVALNECDAIAFKTSREMEGQFCDYVEKVYRKPVFLSGPIVPNTPPTESLEEQWAKWLDGFKPNLVVYCSFGSECILKKEEIRELLLGLELSGYSFLVALRKPEGMESIEEALQGGFEERVGGRGVVHSGWVQQQMILGHPSVGCFVTHCGSGSLCEALVKECQLVLLPYVWNEFLKGVEVDKREEDGWFSREGVCKAVKLVMDEGSEVGREVRANHAKLKCFNHHPGLIQFIAMTVPHVEGLPHGTETTADVPFGFNHLMMTAMDLTKTEIEHQVK